MYTDIKTHNFPLVAQAFENDVLVLGEFKGTTLL